VTDTLIDNLLSLWCKVDNICYHGVSVSFLSISIVVVSFERLFFVNTLHLRQCLLHLYIPAKKRTKYCGRRKRSPLQFDFSKSISRVYRLCEWLPLRRKGSWAMQYHQASCLMGKLALVAVIGWTANLGTSADTPLCVAL